MRCQQCGKLFRWLGHGRQPMYCSDSCRRKANRLKQKLREKGELEADKPVVEKIKVSRTGKVESIPESVAREVREDISSRDFEKMMGHGFADDLEFVTRIARKALTDGATPASAIPGLAKTLLEASKKLDDLDATSNGGSLEQLLKEDSNNDVSFKPES